MTGSTVVDFPLYEVSLTGINITEIKKLFMVLGTNADLTDKITELIGKRDYTFAQTNPSTYPINSYQLCKVGKLVCFSVTNYKKATGRIDSRVIGQIPVEIAPPITLMIPFATTGAVTDTTRNPGNRLIINTDRFGMLVDVEYSNRKNNRLKRLSLNSQMPASQRLITILDES